MTMRPLPFLAAALALVMLYAMTRELRIIADAQIALASEGCYEVPEVSHANR